MNSNNNLYHICQLVSPFSLPTPFFDRSALHINLVCQRIVTGSTGNSAHGGTGNLLAGNAVCLVAAGGFGPGGVGNSSVVVAVCLAIECMGCFFFVVVVGLANCHPSPLLYFYKCGNLVPFHISLSFASVPQCHRGSLFCGAVPQFLMWG